MTTLKNVLALCLCLTCAGVAFGEFHDVVQPSFGDVRLEYVEGHDPAPSNTSGRLLIYFTNGGSKGEWGSVSSYFPGNAGKSYTQVALTACRMLGYSETSRSDGNAHSNPTNASRVWLHNVSCPEDANNILQCNYTVYNNESIGNKISHYEDYYIACTEKQDKTPYHGQVRLCPPDEVPKPNITNPLLQISFGVMQFYDADSKSQTWRNIVDDDSSETTISLTTLDVDTFCQQIGYSHAVIDSALRVSAISNFHFTKCDKGSHAIKTSEISCPSSISQPCLSCCIPSNPPLCDTTCSLNKSVVIRCISDVFARNFPDTGNQTACESLSSTAAQCVNDPDSKYHKLENAIIVLSLLLTFIIIIIFPFLVFCCIYKGKCNKHRGEGEQLLNDHNNSG